MEAEKARLKSLQKDSGSKLLYVLRLGEGLLVLATAALIVGIVAVVAYAFNVELGRVLIFGFNLLTGFCIGLGFTVGWELGNITDDLKEMSEIENKLGVDALNKP